MSGYARIYCSLAACQLDSPPRRLDARRLPAVTMWRALILLSALVVEPALARCKACSHKKLYKGNCGALYKKRGSRWGEWLCEINQCIGCTSHFSAMMRPCRPRGMRRRRLPMSSYDLSETRGDLRTTNRQDSAGTAAVVASSLSRIKKIIFFTPQYVSH